MTIENRLTELGLTLPIPKRPVGSYSSVYEVKLGEGDNRMLFVSGQLSIDVDSGEVIKGKIGSDITPEEGRTAAKMAGLGVTAQLKAHLGPKLSKARIGKLTVLVNATSDFTAHPLVADGCSELLALLFGSVASRAAFGCSSLPLGAAVEVEAVALL